jgi:N-acylglucosamine 2-epimerase
MRIHDRTFEYVFGHFNNPDTETGEWIQILTREGFPQDKVVALPVKDPFHITRNLLLICELLSE